MQTDMNFNFTNKDEPVGKDNADILVGITCIIALIFTVFYILIPEKNIDKMLLLETINKTENELFSKSTRRLINQF